MFTYSAFTETGAHPDNENLPDGKTEIMVSRIFKSSQASVLFLNGAIQMVQNNGIPTFSLWYLHDCRVAYQ